MNCWRGLQIGVLILSGLLFSSRQVDCQSVDQPSATRAHQLKPDHDEPVDPAKLHHPILWHDPGEISALDLYYGQGGKEDQPVAPFIFESEDMNGSNPKFDVRDARRTKWRVKLGGEAQPEVVASRLLWAVGYFVQEDYLVNSAKIENLHIRRGAKLARGGHVNNARFERNPDGAKKIGTWRWKENPFNGTREFNGLRVMMAVMNNWDLKDENNAVHADRKWDRDVFLASDIGATFGTNGISWMTARSRGDVKTFKKSRFIAREKGDKVDFATPAAPAAILAVKLKTYKGRERLEWIGRNIPIADARWIGSLLKQLSHQQLVDAFRAGGFPQDQIEQFVKIVESRIHELTSL